MKYFHAHADYKTVKQIEAKRYHKIRGRKGWLLGWIDNQDICFVKGSGVIWLSLEQLRKILDLNAGGTTEE